MPDRTSPRAPRRAPVNDNPFVKRIGLLLLAFVLLVPVARFLDGDDAEQTVLAAERAEDEPTTTVATTVPTTSTPPTTLPPVVTPPPTAAPVVQTPPPTAAPQPQVTAAQPPATTAKQAPATTAARKAPVVTASAKPAPKPAPTTAAPPPKPVATPPPTAAPATPAPPPPPPVASAYTPAQVEAIIREVWPDDLEEQALAIAKRESKLIPTVRNYCCYGVFAIYYEAGKKFFNSIGVTSAEQLFDPWVNVRAAYALYGIAGWKPWAL
jgi:hypothetical protein